MVPMSCLTSRNYARTHRALAEQPIRAQLDANTPNSAGSSGVGRPRELVLGGPIRQEHAYGVVRLSHLVGLMSMRCPIYGFSRGPTERLNAAYRKDRAFRAVASSKRRATRKVWQRAVPSRSGLRGAARSPLNGTWRVDVHATKTPLVSGLRVATLERRRGESGQQLATSNSSLPSESAPLEQPLRIATLSSMPL